MKAFQNFITLQPFYTARRLCILAALWATILIVPNLWLFGYALFDGFPDVYTPAVLAAILSSSSEMFLMAAVVILASAVPLFLRGGPSGFMAGARRPPGAAPFNGTGDPMQRLRSFIVLRPMFTRRLVQFLWWGCLCHFAYITLTILFEIARTTDTMWSLPLAIAPGVLRLALVRLVLEAVIVVLFSDDARPVDRDAAPVHETSSSMR